jgi:hypothetical protein
MKPQSEISHFPCGCESVESVDNTGKKWVTIYVNPDCRFDAHRIGLVWTWRNGATLRYVDMSGKNSK